MRNHWVWIIVLSVLCGLGLSYLRDPTTFTSAPSKAGTYLSLGPGRRAAVDLPEGGHFEATALGKRFYGLNDSLANFLTIANAVNGANLKPWPLELNSPPPEFEALMNALPPPIREQLNRKLEGVFVGQNLGVYAFTEQIFSHLNDVRPIGGLIVLDIDNVRSTARGKKLTIDDVVTARENSVFETHAAKGKAQSPIDYMRNEDRIEAHLETKPGETWPLEYLLLHELGHVYAINSPAHPNDLDSKTSEAPAAHPFLSQSWTRFDDRRSGSAYSVRKEADFRHRPFVRYFNQGPMPTRELEATYRELATSPFPTLFAAMNPMDDFAESFATYVYTVVLGNPFELRLLHKGKVVSVYKPCWTEQRCAAKRAVLEQILSTSP